MRPIRRKSSRSHRRDQGRERLDVASRNLQSPPCALVGVHAVPERDAFDLRGRPPRPGRARLPPPHTAPTQSKRPHSESELDRDSATCRESPHRGTGYMPHGGRAQRLLEHPSTLVQGASLFWLTISLTRERHLPVICRTLDHRSKRRPAGQARFIGGGACRFHKPAISGRAPRGQGQIQETSTLGRESCAGRGRSAIHAPYLGHLIRLPSDRPSSALQALMGEFHWRARDGGFDHFAALSIRRCKAAWNCDGDSNPGCSE